MGVPSAELPAWVPPPTAALASDELLALAFAPGAPPRRAPKDGTAEAPAPVSAVANGAAPTLEEESPSRPGGGHTPRPGPPAAAPRGRPTLEGPLAAASPPPEERRPPLQEERRPLPVAERPSLDPPTPASGQALWVPWLIAVLLLCAVGGIVWYLSARTDAQALVEARAAYRNRQYPEAYAALARARASGLEDPQLDELDLALKVAPQLDLVESLLKQGDGAGAQRALEAVRAQAPQDARVLRLADSLRTAPTSVGAPPSAAVVAAPDSMAAPKSAAPETAAPETAAPESMAAPTTAAPATAEAVAAPETVVIPERAAPPTAPERVRPAAVTTRPPRPRTEVRARPPVVRVKGTPDDEIRINR